MLRMCSSISKEIKLLIFGILLLAMLEREINKRAIKITDV